jgi:S-DNA-T family DNA segregation ATPase FtsK/SpoIIIE
VVLANVTVAALLTLRIWRPDWFARLVAVPLRCRWRWWFYRRHWRAVMTIAGLAPVYRGQVMLPVLGRVTAAPCTDRVPVRLVSGQSQADFPDRAEGLAHGFRVHMCRVRGGVPGMVVLELVRRDALAEPMPALPVPEETDLRAPPVGRCEDGAAFLIRLHGTHLLIAGATGAGKGLIPVVPGAGHAARDGRPGWSGCGPATRSSWNSPSAGPCSTGTASMPPTRPTSPGCSKRP